jgi:hypothetical protein
MGKALEAAFVDFIFCYCQSSPQPFARERLRIHEQEYIMSGEVLVVTSKVKSFIKANGECNTAAETIEAISKAVEKILADAIKNAKAQGRKTVMARDVASPSHGG